MQHSSLKTTGISLRPWDIFTSNSKKITPRFNFKQLNVNVSHTLQKEVMVEEKTKYLRYFPCFCLLFPLIFNLFRLQVWIQRPQEGCGDYHNVNEVDIKICICYFSAVTFSQFKWTVGNMFAVQLSEETQLVWHVNLLITLIMAVFHFAMPVKAVLVLYPLARWWELLTHLNATQHRPVITVVSCTCVSPSVPHYVCWQQRTWRHRGHSSGPGPDRNRLDWGTAAHPHNDFHGLYLLFISSNVGLHPENMLAALRAGLLVVCVWLALRLCWSSNKVCFSCQTSSSRTGCHWAISLHVSLGCYREFFLLCVWRRRRHIVTHK